MDSQYNNRSILSANYPFMNDSVKFLKLQVDLFADKIKVLYFFI